MAAAHGAVWAPRLGALTVPRVVRHGPGAARLGVPRLPVVPSATGCAATSLRDGRGTAGALAQPGPREECQIAPPADGPLPEALPLEVARPSQATTPPVKASVAALAATPDAQAAR